MSKSRRPSQSRAPETDAHAGHGHEGEQGHPGNSFMAEQMGSEEQTPEFWNMVAGTPELQTKADAIANYRENAIHMAGFMNRFRTAGARNADDPESTTNRIRNSVEWIESGEATLHVLTPTHDGEQRAAAEGRAGQTSYFNTTTDYRNMADYDDRVNASGQPTRNAGIYFGRTGVGGFMSTDGNDLNVINPKTRSDSALAEVFIHEVQHDADQHQSGKNWEEQSGPARTSNPYVAPRWVYNGYQTEFRAYWMNTEDTRRDDFGYSGNTRVNNRTINAVYANAAGAPQRAGAANTSFQNGRQQGIFNHIFRTEAPGNVYMQGTSWTQSYAYLPHYYVFDENFRAMVDNMAVPAAGNLINSVRIQNLSEAMATRNANRVRAAVDALDSMDANYLNDRTLTQDFWDQARSQMTQATVDYLLARLARG
jgi:hypothetical protein